ncbi:MAG: hypothetical protein D6712_08215 [Chloroflexi bacterium]|nr:MAG: hypothetical protein D6712_08215 [Chloroflexota bacterium]
MDIQHLVDRLEDLIDEGRHIFGTRLTMIDEERALEIIDQMRISIPEEIEKAARVLAERERILAQAHEEAARIVQQARQKGEALLDQESSVQAAQARANAIIEKAREDAATIARDADQYVLQVLAQLEQELLKNLSVVRNGINEVNRTVQAGHQKLRGGATVQPAVTPEVQEQPAPVEVEADASDGKK